MTDDLDDFEYEEVRHRFERGDFHDLSEVKIVKKWLRRQEKEREFIVACERASISSAFEAGRAARRANLIAFLALLISVISAREHLGAFAASILGYLGC